MAGHPPRPYGPRNGRRSCLLRCSPVLSRGGDDRGQTCSDRKAVAMATSNIEVFVAAFGTEDEAGTALKDFQTMDREGSIDLIDAAVVVHDDGDKVSFEETADPSGKRWAKRGA